MNEKDLLGRIKVNPNVLGGKPIIRDMRIAVEHILSMLAAGDTQETLLTNYPKLEKEDIQACILYAHKVVAHESFEPFEGKTGA